VELTMAYAHMHLLDHRDLAAADSVFNRIDCAKYEHRTAGDGRTWQGILCYKTLSKEMRTKAA
jgi:hypothetical protein